MTRTKWLAAAAPLLAWGCADTGQPDRQRVADVQVYPAAAVVAVGVAEQFGGRLYDDRGNLCDRAAIHGWSSSNAAVAVVDGRGRATGLSPGTAVIIAESGGVRGTAVLQVRPEEPLVWAREGAGWQEDDLVGIWGSSASDVWAVGSGYMVNWEDWSAVRSPLLVHYDGRAWQQTWLPEWTRPADVWGSGASDVFVVGDAAAVLHWDGAAWAGQPLEERTALVAVWGRSATDVYAVGDAIVHYDGVAWTRMTAPHTAGLLDVWGTGAADVYAVGRGGAILHYDGTAWSAMASPTTQPLKRIWGSGPADIHAAGASGTLLHFDGTAWRQVGLPTDAHLCGLWGSGSGDAYVSGVGGTLLHFDGDAWVRLESPAPQLCGLWVAPGGDVLGLAADGIYRARRAGR